MPMFTTRPEIRGTFGVVASTHWIASAVGMSVLEKGGNAFDAAVATAFTLQVVEPHLNGPGGDVPAIVHDVRRGKTEVICGQGVAPAGATIAHYRNEGLDLVPGTGLLAAVVPGTFETWMLLLRDYGSMSLADVLSSAIGYAENGHPLLERANSTIATVAAMFRDHWPTSAAIYLPNNEVPAAGSLFTNKTLAATYRRIIKEAESAGSDRVAQIERAQHAAAEGVVGDEQRARGFGWRSAQLAQRRGHLGQSGRQHAAARGGAASRQRRGGGRARLYQPISGRRGRSHDRRDGGGNFAQRRGSRADGSAKSVSRQRQPDRGARRRLGHDVTADASATDEGLLAVAETRIDAARRRTGAPRYHAAQTAKRAASQPVMADIAHQPWPA